LFPLFATGVVDTKGKFAAGIVDTGGKIATSINTPVLPVLLTVTLILVVHLDLRISPRIFEKI
jgi:hypothetical protein